MSLARATPYADARSRFGDSPTDWAACRVEQGDMSGGAGQPVREAAAAAPGILLWKASEWLASDLGIGGTMSVGAAPAALVAGPSN